MLVQRSWVHRRTNVGTQHLPASSQNNIFLKPANFPNFLLRNTVFHDVWLRYLPPRPPPVQTHHWLNLQESVNSLGWNGDDLGGRLSTWIPDTDGSWIMIRGNGANGVEYRSGFLNSSPLQRGALQICVLCHVTAVLQ